jgi:hypothetical protein
VKLQDSIAGPDDRAIGQRERFFLMTPELDGHDAAAPYLKFVLGVALSSLAYDVVLMLLGLSARFGLRHFLVKPETYLITGFIIFVVVLWVVLYLIHRLGIRRQRNQGNAGDLTHDL